MAGARHKRGEREGKMQKRFLKGIAQVCAIAGLCASTGLAAEPTIAVQAGQCMDNTITQCGCASANWVEIATFFTVLIGGVFAWWQWRQACRVSHAEHLNAIMERYGSKRMTDLFYRLVNNAAYGGEDSAIFYLGGLCFQDTKGKGNEGNTREDDIDSMLLLFSQVCHEHGRRTISDSEFAFFCYQIRRTLAHKQFKQYLLDFAQYCGKFKIGYPYHALVQEGLNVDREFYERVLAKLGTKKGGVMNIVKEMLP